MTDVKEVEFVVVTEENHDPQVIVLGDGGMAFGIAGGVGAGGVGASGVVFAELDHNQEPGERLIDPKKVPDDALLYLMFTKESVVHSMIKMLNDVALEIANKSRSDALSELSALDGETMDDLDFAISELEQLPCEGGGCLTWQVDTCKDQVLAWLKELREMKVNKSPENNGEE